MMCRSVLLNFFLLAQTFLVSISALETDSYSPSDDVKQGHGLPHFTPASSGSREGDYVISTVVPAAAITVVGVLAVVIFQLVLCARFCMRRWACCGVSKTNSSFRGNLMIFTVLMILVVLSAHMLFIGNSGINDGLNDAADGLEGLKDEFNTLVDTSTDLIVIGTDLVDDSAATGAGSPRDNCCGDSDCSTSGTPFIVAYDTVFDIFGVQGDLLKTVGDALLSLVGDVPDSLETAETAMRVQAVNSKNIVIYVMYAAIIVITAGYAAAVYFNNKVFTQLMIFVSEITVIVLTLICGVFMFVVTVLGDFCMKPADNILDMVKSVGNQTEIIEILEYYLKCTGSSPIGTDLDEGADAINYVVGNITSSFQADFPIANYAPAGTMLQCEADIDSLLDSATGASSSLVDLISFFKCDVVNTAWSKIVNEGLCTSGYSGFYALWVALYMTSFGLFFVMCITSILFKQYEYQLEDHDHDGEISYDANDQQFLSNPGVQMVQYEDGTVGPLDPQQGENFGGVVYGKAV